MYDDPTGLPSLAPHTADVAEMIAAGHIAAAKDLHCAYALAEFEREDLGASEANMPDIWMAGALLLAVCAARTTGPSPTHSPR